jgi:hypothetical protein
LQRITGDVALLMTTTPLDEVRAYFRNWSVREFAKGGTLSPISLRLEPGYEALQHFPVQMLERLRKLGLVAEVDDGRLLLREPFVVAVEGQLLSFEQAKLLVRISQCV